MEQLLEKIMSMQSRSDSVNTSLFDKREHIEKLHRTCNLLRKVQVPPMGLFPNCLVQQQVLYPFWKQVGGTILSAKLAKERGWAINKWSKGKQKEKVNNQVLFDQGTYDKLLSEAPKFKLITPSILSDRLREGLVEIREDYIEDSHKGETKSASFIDALAPAEFEGILMSHPSIEDAAVVPQKDDVAGEVPVAFVVRSSNDPI
ncbi:uncharacterized protein LOC107618240 isoform X3 [Arachis ipaensis]|uniref:uncharacterized protein LOC107618240 isoform X3 n=1 Tax=Arachis ipaensis TaxID=130454 RepID=UPI000A2B11CA|nr:uncharacterized protein LOC107618240 isoform X3 [Arachis ipaensis]XP_020966045.1 uncharacterized protein LOC107618240 isoform X3 [Arachis ipaensis]